MSGILGFGILARFRNQRVSDIQPITKGRWKVIDEGPCNLFNSEGPSNLWKCERPRRAPVKTLIADCRRNTVYLSSTQPSILHEELARNSGLIDEFGRGPETDGRFLRIFLTPKENIQTRMSPAGEPVVEAGMPERPYVSYYSVSDDWMNNKSGTKEEMKRCLCNLVADKVVNPESDVTAIAAAFGGDPEELVDEWPVKAKVGCVLLREEKVDATQKKCSCQD